MSTNYEKALALINGFIERQEISDFMSAEGYCNPGVSLIDSVKKMADDLHVIADHRDDLSEELANARKQADELTAELDQLRDCYESMRKDYNSSEERNAYYRGLQREIASLRNELDAVKLQFEQHKSAATAQLSTEQPLTGGLLVP
jgi:uncharacterized coiled-coil DUF342 family protein